MNNIDLSSMKSATPIPIFGLIIYVTRFPNKIFLIIKAYNLYNIQKIEK
jgi:hypothetical protein